MFLRPVSTPNVIRHTFSWDLWSRRCVPAAFYSSQAFSEAEITKAKQWHQQFTASSIPIKEFEVAYSRASGPGGQKVNKTSSKATVSLAPDRWLNPQFCYWIPAAIRSQLKTNKIRYETKTGGVLIQSDTSRNRDVNTTECLNKLLIEIKKVAYFEEEMTEEDKKKWEELKERSREKRLIQKKRTSDKKKSRSKNFDI
ncbi:aminoacyl-tRNA hydrolase [Yamadazyma tenuis]|uniref:Prokaryotic-type class I peptide chain release factors domain-containing protein n=1 Tax=Candida tenuis (strain ATCC 10573 / BCRC 21748 / CBS 615 / JCM 9827 / NBRC 10315 / NRRL Y-1498 / VKM Y-70) TaxID=590646 RepID=G3B844_CANTC|nr:uncharacterized protein CANTEDRAFT_108011 [Yamadazyma tenuis ATCC 10573]EGV62345.1 hypothetical protein CANTEDRAFT_108011 [Yamadazyma tenuis ATCC 10573]WEJ93610.1 aminoacyl-tRNA hydrolase [Yamadazyma tenuis]